MVNSNITCPKCKSAMEEGFIADHTAQSSATVSKWVEGEPKRSFWLGIKTDSEVNLPVKTFRCIRCGYLESYAQSHQD
jgi:predicted nucleic-acid-binding Zn-ribbon protein